MSIRLLCETPWDISPDNTSSFKIYNPDDQYILGNASDSLQKYDGVNFVNLGGSPPNGNIMAVYKDRLMVAGDPAFPHKIWFSHIRNGEGWTKETDWIEIYPEDGGKINGMGIEADELIVSKDNGRLYGWLIYEDGQPENSRLRVVEDDKGFINQKARTVIDNVMYYLDRERLDTVPVSTSGGVSYIVEDVVRGIKDFNKVAVGSNDGRVYVALGDITIDLGDEVSLTNAVLVYDVVTTGFYIRDNMDIRVFSKFVDTDGQEKLFFGDSTGRVYKTSQGNLAGGNPIHMRIRTRPYFRDLGKIVHVKNIGVWMDDADATVVNYRTDLNKGFVKNVGTVIKEPVQWFPVDITGPLLQLEFTHSNVNARPRLLRIKIDYEEQGQPE